MGKVIKVIDLLNESTKGNNLTFRKDGGSYTDSLWSFLDMYLYKKMSFKEIVRWLNSDVEILEEHEIDIQSIEEINHYNICSCIPGKTEENINNELKKSSLVINQLVQAVKQLDNKLKEK